MERQFFWYCPFIEIWKSFVFFKNLNFYHLKKKTRDSLNFNSPFEYLKIINIRGFKYLNMIYYDRFYFVLRCSLILCRVYVCQPPFPTHIRPRIYLKGTIHKLVVTCLVSWNYALCQHSNINVDVFLDHRIIMLLPYSTINDAIYLRQ